MEFHYRRIGRQSCYCHPVFAPQSDPLNRVADQPICGGLTVNVALSSSNPSSGTIPINPVGFAPNTFQANTAFDPLVPGALIISLNRPPGFDAPSILQQVMGIVTGP